MKMLMQLMEMALVVAVVGNVVVVVTRMVTRMRRDQRGRRERIPRMMGLPHLLLGTQRERVKNLNLYMS